MSSDTAGHGPESLAKNAPRATSTSADTPAGENPPTVAAWRRLATLGLFALPVVFVLSQVVNEVVIPPLIVFSVLAVGLGAALVAGKGRRVLYAAVALGVISVLASAPFLVADLSHPETGAGFLVAYAALVLGLGTAGAALAATRANPPDRARVTGLALGGVLVLGAVGSLVATASVEDDQRQDGDIVVVARDTAFPATLEAPAGTVGFFVQNEDLYRHTLLIEGTDVKVELPGSTDRRFEADLDAGEYRYFCDVPGHESMEATLVVR
ncbi:MAG: cupredoxin domain-containing protein [Acidimicrobiales bacterium]|nr:cupredoxin domain-containing protein [Acidimicrobiales bacterium]